MPPLARVAAFLITLPFVFSSKALWRGLDGDSKVALQAAVSSHLRKLTSYGFTCRTWTFGIDTTIRVNTII
jgi:hypothetical protein